MTEPSAAHPDPGVAVDLAPDEGELAEALRRGLAGYELAEEDVQLVDGAAAEGAESSVETGEGPVVAVVGRPNVGKSTLINRILGRREAVVEDVPGVTRDRVSYAAEWTGHDFTVVDTGGWDSRVEGVAALAAAQAELAIELADVVLFVVDAVVGATAADEEVVRLLRRAGKPAVLAANKVDDARGEADAAALWSLGLGEPHPISAMHGRGVGDLLDELVAVFPAPAAPGRSRATGPRRVALVGRPNVGKSSLLNALSGGQRAVVDSVAGTTRDPVDELVELAGRPWRVVDTAGIRRRLNASRGADYYAVLRTRAAIERCEVAVVLLDAAEPLTEQDVRVVQQVVEAGRALVLAVNKWDLLDEERRYYLERELETELGHVSWAPRVNLSARTGRHTAKLVPAMDTALESWDRRVSTGRLNALIAEIGAAHPHPVRGGRQPRILYATQAAARPPRFVLFTTGFLEAGYRRFVERRLREHFGFTGSPIELAVRSRRRRRDR